MANRKCVRAAQGAGTIRKKTVMRKGQSYTYWEARVTTGRDPGTGKQVQKSFTGKTQREVREKMQAAAVEVNNSSYLEPSKLTLAQWLDIWLADFCADKKYLTVQQYRSAVENHIKPALGAIKLADLAPMQVQQFYNRLSQTPASGKQNAGKDTALSPKTVRNIHGVLSKALTVAVQMDAIRLNPCDRVTLPKVVRKEIRPLSDAEIKAFVAAVDGDEYADILKVILFTGLRESEAVGLTWDCVDFASGALKINKQLQRRAAADGGYTFAPLKNNKTRMLTAPGFVMDILRARRARQMEERFAAGPLWRGYQTAEEQKTALVFTKPTGEHINITVLYNHLKRIMAQIGTPESRVHDLRHTYAVLSLQNGDSVKTVQQNLGHATAAFTLDVYGHVSEKMRAESAEKMQEYFKSIEA